MPWLDNQITELKNRDEFLLELTRFTPYRVRHVTTCSSFSLKEIMLFDKRST